MFSAFERLVARRYLRARRKEGFISVIAGFSLIGIALGVATLIIVMSVMGGFREELLSRLLGVNGHINVYGRPLITGAAQQPVQDYDRLAAELAQVPGVLAAVPLVSGQALLTVPGNDLRAGKSSGAAVRGLRVEDFTAKPIFSDETLKAGRFDELGDGQAIIGERLSAELGLPLGASFTLTSGSAPVATPFGNRPRQKQFTVTGIFEVGMYEFDRNFIYIDLREGQVLFEGPDQVSTIELTIANPNRPQEVEQAAESILGHRHFTWNWQQSNQSFVEALQVERTVMFFILSLLILIAAFNIISGLIMLVKDKARNIAILRTMGAARSSILSIFFMTGAAIGVIGTAVGVVLGVVITLKINEIKDWLESVLNVTIFPADVYWLSHLPTILDGSQVLLIVGMALGLSFLATLYPAWRAAKTDPVEALRYE